MLIAGLVRWWPGELAFH